MNNLEKTKEFSKEIIEIAKKYGIKSICSCSCCDGIGIYFNDSDECFNNFGLGQGEISFCSEDGQEFVVGK